MSYGSLQESKYLLSFSNKQEFIKNDEFEKGSNLAEKIGAMLWSEIKKLENSIKS